MENRYAYTLDEHSSFISITDYARILDVDISTVMYWILDDIINGYLTIEKTIPIKYDSKGSGSRPALLLAPGIYKQDNEAFCRFFEFIQDGREPMCEPFYDMGKGWLASGIDDQSREVKEILILKSELDDNVFFKQANIKHKETDKEISSNQMINAKTRNSYLRVIRALSSALIEGLTGKHSTDAQAVLNALSSKGISPPVGDAALASYLKQAATLDD